MDTPKFRPNQQVIWQKDKDLDCIVKVIIPHPVYGYYARIRCYYHSNFVGEFNIHEDHLEPRGMFYNIGDKVDIMYFDKPEKVEIIDFDRSKCLYECRFLDSHGSAFYSDYDLYIHKKRVEQYYSREGVEK